MMKQDREAQQDAQAHQDVGVGTEFAELVLWDIAPVAAHQ